MNETPYASSLAEPAQIAAPLADKESVRQAFVAWEKLRVVFNAVLALGSISFLLASMENPMDHLVILVEGAVAANIAFCVGPVAEGYLNLLGAHRPTARGFVFALGLLAGVLLAFLAINIHLANA